MRDTVAGGIATGELATASTPEDIATVVIAALEGGVLMSKLYRDSGYARSVAAFLSQYVRSLEASPHV